MRPLVDKWRALFDAAATLAPARATSDEMRAFAFDFYRLLQSNKPDNLIFSPFSIWLALMMVCARRCAVMIEKRPPVIRFDRPFLYAIYDKPTGTILFMGRVMNPAE